jgi:hypothetical protein
MLMLFHGDVANIFLDVVDVNAALFFVLYNHIIKSVLMVARDNL